MTSTTHNETAGAGFPGGDFEGSDGQLGGKPKNKNKIVLHSLQELRLVAPAPKPAARPAAAPRLGGIVPNKRGRNCRWRL
jgi:hypothetical protein